MSFFRLAAIIVLAMALNNATRSLAAEAVGHRPGKDFVVDVGQAVEQGRIDAWHVADNTARRQTIRLGEKDVECYSRRASSISFSTKAAMRSLGHGHCPNCCNEASSMSTTRTGIGWKLRGASL